MIDLVCSCGKKYSFKDEMAGRRGKCKQCGAIIEVPRTGTGAGAPPRNRPAGSLPWNAKPKRKLSKIEKRCSGNDVYLMGGSRRFFSGIGQVEFRGDVLIVKGPLGPDLLEIIYLLFPVLVVGNLILIFIHLPFEMIPILFNVVCFLLLVVRPLLSRENKSIRILRDKISSVACEGPVMTMQLSAAPVPGLNAIRMFVPEGLRNRFFREFDRMFPELLPKEYRAALQAIRGPSQESEE
jgi:hypothetical protein